MRDAVALGYTGLQRICVAAIYRYALWKKGYGVAVI